MRVKELEEALLARLGQAVEKYRFDPKPRGEVFYKKTAFGRVAFAPGFIRHQADVDVTAYVTVRFDELEDLVNEPRDHLSKTDKKKTSSLGVELGNLSEG